eukprot:TRINITY_DN66_c0_g1_i1.p1 TRINITY_DN66_c0_g1~~TRINITY_DN66_c0_g1_i1.p1  ORF type:complete len:346 (-),score=74.23 TRINITY_DN66_c0_g1_i1:73-1110(-)
MAGVWTRRVTLGTPGVASQWSAFGPRPAVATSVFAIAGNNNMPEGVRNAGNLKEIRIRIGAVKNIKKITSTMKLVAASKLSRAQRMLEEMRPFGDVTQSFIDSQYPRFAVDEEGKEVELDDQQVDEYKNIKGKHLVVAMTSDRGLCGAVNGSVVRTAKKMASLNPGNTTVAAVGDKSVAGLTSEFGSAFKVTVSGVSGNTKTSFTEISQVADRIFTLPFEKLTVVHNKFVSVLTFRTARRAFPSRESFTDKKRYASYEFEGDRDTVLNDYYAWTFGSFLYSSVIENQATELGSRMTSMDNATTNASDVLKKLEIKYNKSRQAAITTELTEIVSGAAAIQAMEDND